MPTSSRLRGLLLLPLALLSGCGMVVLHPAGVIAMQQGHLIVVSTVLMLLIVVPVMVLTLCFAWRYRHSNSAARYAPDWDHSTQLELIIWAAPLLIIIALGALTWISSHTLDPYRALRNVRARAAATASGATPGSTPAADTGPAALPAAAAALESAPAPEPAAALQPLVVEVVALDWKWLFIYPQQGIAVVNEAAAPVDRPLEFRITASSVMNSFFVPALAGQIYAMPGMQTELHAAINQPGEFAGFSANYSGAGFSDMRFRFRGLSARDFAQWVLTAQAAGRELDTAAYLQLVRPSERAPVRRYSAVAPDLYDNILRERLE